MKSNFVNLPHTSCRIGKYAPFGDEPLPTVHIGVLEEKDGIIALDKPGCIYTFLGFFHYSGYPQLYDLIKHFWPEGCHAHRIDGTTSGCHMAGDSHAVLSRVTTGWKTKTHKAYLAVVDRKPKWDYVEVTQNVIANGRTWAPCTTGLTYMGEQDEMHTVKAELLDGGRTHQIRKALQSVGFPIVGDTLYGGNPLAARPLLHAWQVTIDDWGTVAAPTPSDMPDVENEFLKPYLWSFDVPPIPKWMQDKLEEFRRMNGPSGVLQEWRDFCAEGLHIGQIYDSRGEPISKRQLILSQITHMTELVEAGYA